MAHMIWEQNGRHQMFVVGDRSAAWHHLGQRTDKAVNWKEAMQLAGLDWTVMKRPLFARSNSTGTELFEIPDQVGIFRDSDGAYLGTVGDGYEPIQNIRAFEFIDTLLESIDGAHYDSAGALQRGNIIWVSATVPMGFEVTPGDRHETYLNFSTSHDGSLKARGKLMTTRVVCWNTLSSGLKESSAEFSVKHTASAESKFAAARELMQGVRQNVATLTEKLRTLASRRMTRDTMVDVMDRLFPKAKKEKSTRRDNVVKDVLAAYESNDRNAFPEQRGTAFNLLNAVTEYTDHQRTARVTDAKANYTVQQARAESAVFGSGDALKTRALDLILETTAGNPVVARQTFVMTSGLLDAALDAAPSNI